MTELDLVSTKTLDDEFDRKKRYINGCGFDEETLRRRELEMGDLKKAYPDMCISWLELCWNYCEFTPKEEQDNIIKNKLWEGKPTNRRHTGGIMKNSMNIISKSEYEIEKAQKAKADLTADISGN